ncbi:hypothetical protein N7537_007785 [Penicillium hordei]|uniref:Uncharacterized protein n=1 Tax=Penicillium hordei TaxID=40994 RepID=A0AAD6DZA2_9EURO|nr:uncharacterized protein N7537_007785 [Penicillium hordei]KAJ5597701.1 hypothetical protein N7537_007785 [Penicillium hordei]
MAFLLTSSWISEPINVFDGRLSGWFGMGMLLSSQFAALSAAKPEQNAATSVTTYYFAQQLGLMTGITTVKALLIREMRHGLNVTLKDQPGRAKVRLNFSIPSL